MVRVLVYHNLSLVDMLSICIKVLPSQSTLSGQQGIEWLYKAALQAHYLIRPTIPG